jgi:hypothetical protein
MKKTLLIATLLLLSASTFVKAEPINIHSSIEDGEKKFHSRAAIVDIDKEDSLETVWTKLIPFTNKDSLGFEPVPPVTETTYTLLFAGKKITADNWAEVKTTLLKSLDKQLHLVKKK